MRAKERKGLLSIVLFILISVVACKKTAAPLLAQTQSYQSDQIADMAGVNCHFAYSGVYRDSFLTLKSRLQELGVRHIRDENNGGDSTFKNRINQIAGLGIKFDIVCEVWGSWQQSVTNLISIKNLSNSPLEFIEYPNELDTSRAQVTAYINFYNAYKGTPVTSSIPIFGPSFSNPAAGPSYFLKKGGSDLTSKMDYANLHSYPRGQYVEGPQGGGSGGGPGQSLDSSINQYRLINSGAKPLVASETGYQLQQPGHHSLPVAESVAAKYEPRLLMWYLKKGFKYVYHYQLVNSDTKENFGILNTDLSRRQSFNAIKNTISLFNDPGPSFHTGNLSYSLSGNTANIKSMLFQKRNGKFYLVLWQAVSSGTASDNIASPPVDFNNPTVPITVNIKGITGTAIGYTPSISANPVARFSSINSIELNVPDHIYVLEISH